MATDLTTTQPGFLRGYTVPVDDARTSEVTGALERTCAALGRIVPFAPTDERADLVYLREDCEATLGFIRAAGSELPSCTLELLIAIAPYLERLPRRLESDLAKTTCHDQTGRFAQLSRLLCALRAADGAHHPAALLAICDGVLNELRSTCDLRRVLEPAVQRQWTPILVDARFAVSRLGSASLLLGATAVVGRIALLYPLVHVAAVVVDIANKLDPGAHGGGGRPTARLDAADGLRLAKGLLLLWAATKVVAVVALYVSIGYTCLAAGVGCLVVTHGVDDAPLKAIAPILAPIAAPIADLVAQVARRERASASSVAAASVVVPNTAAIATPVVLPLNEIASAALVCSKCTFENAAYRTTCEMCESAL